MLNVRLRPINRRQEEMGDRDSPHSGHTYGNLGDGDDSDLGPQTKKIHSVATKLALQGF